MKLLTADGYDVATPDDFGCDGDYGAVYQTVPEFMAKIEDPQLVIKFAKKFVEAITIYEKSATDRLRHIPFVATECVGGANPLMFIFKEENNGNTYRVIDD